MCSGVIIPRLHRQAINPPLEAFALLWGHFGAYASQSSTQRHFSLVIATLTLTRLVQVHYSCGGTKLNI